MEKFVQIADEGAMIVMGRYEQQPHEQTAHQSEAALEESFIQKLVSQGYERLHINNEADLLLNLRRQLEVLNEVELSDSEWQRLKVMLLGEQMGIEEKTEIIQHNNILSLPMDNGINRNICIIDRKNIHRNRPLQVLNQFEEEKGVHKTRYDVTILVNGLPLVHIELKRRGIPIKEAFNQISRYQRNSFWAGTGLYDYAQLFIISNGTETKYYSNTTRYAHVMEQGSVRKASAKRESNTFEFTSYWTDTDNNRVADLTDFAERFLNRKMLLYTLTRYCVFTVDKSLMVMRPYQIAATEAILRRINQSLNNRSWLGTTQAGGYIWHTTGSGKTLTSFKTAQLASMDERIKKVLFVVDRKDLDYQTMKEYDNFEKDCANSNSSSRILLRQLKDKDCRIIITTIQKLANLMKPAVLGKDEQLQEVMKQETVVIFDECHRSQFGDMQKQIRRSFKRYMMFGFTGTPIFADSRTALDAAIREYNQWFGTNYSTDGDKFQSYYKDVSLRMKDKQIDLLIVVGMFLTGFDAKTLNTLWVDKNLKMHGLLQAFSRTNRILNAVKNCGNIVCFRNLEEATNKCLGLFGDKDASGIVLMRPFDDYYNGYEEVQKNGKERHVEGYVELVEALLEKFPLQKLANLASEQERKEFILSVGAVLKMQNLLTSFDEFTPDKFIITEFQMQDYLGWYRSHYDIYKKEREESAGKNESIEDEVVYELELVKQVSIGIDYILALVAQYHESNCQDATIRVKIQKALDASPDLKDKKELVERFIERQTPSGESIVDHWEEYVKQQRRADLDDIIRQENLKSDETYQFMQQSFDEEGVITTGLGITKILPPMPLFGGGQAGRAEKKKTVIGLLEAFFKKYFNLIEDNNI